MKIPVLFKKFAIRSRFKKIWRKHLVEYPLNKYPLPDIEYPVSQLCTENQFLSEAYRNWLKELRQEHKFYRKIWEYVYILQVLKTNNMLEDGKYGLGFGVGKEPLSSVLAKNNCRLIITDLDKENAKKDGWVNTDQYASEVKELNNPEICENAKFKSNVEFIECDMNNINKEFLKNQFDFLWSSCALEHLGSIQNGTNFIINSLECLKPDGVAVHTTEYNISSNFCTVDNNPTVLFREKDIREIIFQAEKKGFYTEFNPNYGTGKLDLYYDIPPYNRDKHLKLLFEKYITTSIGMVFKRRI